MAAPDRTAACLTKPIVPYSLSQRLNALKGSVAIGLNVGARLLGARVVFAPDARGHKLYSPKERNSARTLTSRRISWEPGPSLEWQGRRYRGDLFLRTRGILLEVLSSGELEKDTLERLAAFHSHGLRTELIGDEQDLAAFLGRG